jgi:hypothetical protein
LFPGAIYWGGMEAGMIKDWLKINGWNWQEYKKSIKFMEISSKLSHYYLECSRYS